MLFFLLSSYVYTYDTVEILLNLVTFVNDTTSSDNSHAEMFRKNYIFSQTELLKLIFALSM
jgi:hypothetical protein